MNPEQMRDASLLELFQLETRTQVQVLNNGLLALEHDPTSAPQLEACMRAAHSLKGAARIVDLHPAVRIAHAMEDSARAYCGRGTAPRCRDLPSRLDRPCATPR